MKHQTLPVRRNPVSKGVFKRLSAVTRSRKQRVAATANDELDHEDHSSKIARALTIIFLIHIAVIGLIFFHQKYLDRDPGKTADSTKKATPAAPVRENKLPKLSSGDATYIVSTGDNYDRIAAKHKVDVNDLKAANNNVEIISGLILKIPPNRIVAVDPPEVVALRANSPLDRDRGLVEAVPVGTSGGAPKAKLVKPAVERDSIAAAPLATPAAPVASGKTYVVQAGDNVWRIANRFKVDQKALMKANGISDPKKLKLGMSLKIPR